jgi:hypothetical protein
MEAGANGIHFAIYIESLKIIYSEINILSIPENPRKL